MMINDETAARRGAGQFDVHELMKRAEDENAAELAEHGTYQRTFADETEAAYKDFEIGMFELARENHREAKRWLSSAVGAGVEEARPFLRICVDVLNPIAESRIASEDENAAELADKLIGLADQDQHAATPVSAKPSILDLTDTPIPLEVAANAPMVLDIHRHEGLAQR